MTVADILIGLRVRGVRRRENQAADELLALIALAGCQEKTRSRELWGARNSGPLPVALGGGI